MPCARRPSVPRRVGGHPRDERVAASLAREHRRPQISRRLREGVAAAGGLEDPVTALDLSIELARAPTRVAHERAPLDYACALGRVTRTEHAHVIEGDEGGIARVLEPCEHHHRRGLDRAAY